MKNPFLIVSTNEHWTIETNYACSTLSDAIALADEIWNEPGIEAVAVIDIRDGEIAWHTDN